MDIVKNLIAIRSLCETGWTPKPTFSEPGKGCIYQQIWKGIEANMPLHKYDYDEYGYEKSILTKEQMEDNRRFNTSYNAIRQVVENVVDVSNLVDWNDNIATKEDILHALDKAIEVAAEGKQFVTVS